MSAIEFGKFGAIPFEEFSEQVGTRVAEWNTVPVAIQNKQYSYICKYLAKTDVQNVPDEQWKRLSERIHRVVEIDSAHLETACDNMARQIYYLNRISKRELHLGELDCAPLLLLGPESHKAIVSTKTFDTACGADARAYRLGLSTFSDRGVIDLTDCSVPAFSAIIAFLAGKDITATLTAESIGSVFAKAHLWNAPSLKNTVVARCKQLLNDLLAQDDKEPAKQFFYTVIDPIALLDDDTKAMMLPLLSDYYLQTLGRLGSSNFATYAELLLRYQMYDSMQEVCTYIANSVNAEPDDSAPEKMFSMLKELAVVQEQYPNSDLMFPYWFMANVFSSILSIMKGKNMYLFQPSIEEPDQPIEWYPFQFICVFGRGQPRRTSHIPSTMRNKLMEIMNREGISSLIRMVTLKPLDDAPSTRAKLGAFLRRELVSARNMTSGPKKFRIAVSSELLSAPNIVDYYSELCKPLATAYAPLNVSAETY